MFRWPQTRAEFWREKITKNIERDRRVLCRLKNQEWRVLTVWECALKGTGRVPLAELLDRCEAFIRNGTSGIDKISGTLRFE